MRVTCLRVVACGVLAAIATATTAAAATDGVEGNGRSTAPALSGDGRFLAFGSTASNLVAGDTNGTFDVFVRELSARRTELVTVGVGGAPANGPSVPGAVSKRGRYVAFTSTASNLVPADTNGQQDVFVGDRKTSKIRRVSVAANGTQADAGGVFTMSMSANGRLVAFQSFASNLVPGDANGGGLADVFVADARTGAIRRIAFPDPVLDAAYERTDPALSADGRFVAFVATTEEFVDQSPIGVWIADLATGELRPVSTVAQANGLSSEPSVSADGRFVAFSSNASNLVPGDENDQIDVFVRDMQTGQLRRLSVTPDGTDANEESTLPSISANGRFVAFLSRASNLVPGDTNGQADVFVADVRTGRIVRASLGDHGAQANGESGPPTLSANGRVVGFASDASNLVPDDTNGLVDVFAHFLRSGRTVRASVGSAPQ